MRHNIDYLFLNCGLFEVRGYRFPEDGTAPGEIRLESKNGERIRAIIEDTPRPDVADAFSLPDRTAPYGFYAAGECGDPDVFLVFTDRSGRVTDRISLKKEYKSRFSPLRRILASDKQAFDFSRDFGTEKHPYAHYYRLYENAPLISAREVREKAGEQFRFLLDETARFSERLPEIVREEADAHPEVVVFYGDSDEISGNVHRKPLLFGSFDRIAARYGSKPAGFFAVRSGRADELITPSGKLSLKALLKLEREEPGSARHIPRVLSSFPSSESRISLVENDLDALGPIGGLPLVSVLIPNRDQHEALEKAVRSLYETSTYEAIETIVIENHSEDPETFRTYERLQSAYPSVRVITYEEPFNYSAINNMAARQARGEYLLLLNNDTEVISPDFLYQLLVPFLEDDSVGASGAMLLYRDGTIQHGGVLAGAEKLIAHRFLSMNGCDPGYRNLNAIPSTVSAVTGACMLTKKSVYESLGGLDEALTIAYNDIDYCLRLEGIGLRSVYRPTARLFHDESKTRGYEDSDEKRERLSKERAVLETRHKERLLSDPYYPPLLKRIRGIDFFTGKYEEN